MDASGKPARLRRMTQEHTTLPVYLLGGVYGPERAGLHGPVAGIEVILPEMERSSACGGENVQELKALGFRYVTLDREEFPRGSRDEVL